MARRQVILAPAMSVPCAECPGEGAPRRALVNHLNRHHGMPVSEIANYLCLAREKVTRVMGPVVPGTTSRGGRPRHTALEQDAALLQAVSTASSRKRGLTTRNAASILKTHRPNAFPVRPITRAVVKRTEKGDP